MPARSKRQLRLMQAVEHGWKGGPKGLSAAEAKHFVDATPKGGKGLPLRVKREKR